MRRQIPNDAMAVLDPVGGHAPRDVSNLELKREVACERLHRAINSIQEI